MRSARTAILAATCIPLAATALAGCKTTQQLNDRKELWADRTVASRVPVHVAKQNPDVKVLSTSTLKDKNGEAVVVRMRNVGKQPLADLPVSVKLADKGGKAVYTNTQPGLETAALPPAEPLDVEPKRAREREPTPKLLGLVAVGGHLERPADAVERGNAMLRTFEKTAK